MEIHAIPGYTQQLCQHDKHPNSDSGHSCLKNGMSPVFWQPSCLLVSTNSFCKLSVQACAENQLRSKPIWQELPKTSSFKSCLLCMKATLPNPECGKPQVQIEGTNVWHCLTCEQRRSPGCALHSGMSNTQVPNSGQSHAPLVP